MKRVILAIALTTVVALALWPSSGEVKSDVPLGGHVVPFGSVEAPMMQFPSYIFSANITVAGDNYTAWRDVDEIRAFVINSNFPFLLYEDGKYDCFTWNYKTMTYGGSALDFAAYAKTQGRFFIPFAEHSKGSPDAHVLTLTVIGNRVYRVDPMIADGRPTLIGKVN
uniref:Uncharacterized protein n=1 Tax=viral metagenome TaxID=1070528 RepID=A0A6M3JL24_9ZZZZ